MLNDTFKIVLMGGKAAALGAMFATTAMAQTVVETPAGNTAVVVDPALQAEKPVGAVTQQAFPLPEQFENDQAVSEALLAQGFTDIRILREGPIMTVTAQRNGVPTELVYSTANGTLISVDGVEMRAAPDATGDGQTTPAPDAAPEAPADDTATDDDSATPDDGTAPDDSTDTGTDTDGATDGTDGTTDTDAGTDSGADAGADSGTDSGADADSDAGTDGGAEGGGDAGSDGGSDGESDGGSDSDS